RDHECPESDDHAVNTPLAPPLDQRSCCHTAIRLAGLAGLMATCGSTSAFMYEAPLGPAMLAQPAEKGDGPDTCTSPARAGFGVVEEHFPHAAHASAAAA